MIIVTDTFHQTNGVSTTYKNIKSIARSRKRNFKVIHPGLFNWVPMPGYPEIQLCIQPFRLWHILNRINPPQLHIATEGFMGMTARLWCKLKKRPFTSAYNTKFPEYLNVMLRIPLAWSYAYLRRFHGSAKTTFVTTESMRKDLSAQGFKDLTVWTRGVSDQLISISSNRPASKKLHVLNVGRVSVEKNLDALCALEDDFEITIVGDGPYLKTLQHKYKKVHFLGYRFGKALADIYASHDVFAFPSRTDTFGIVMIEAMCNGLPIAGYDVAGPRDVIDVGLTGYTSHDLQDAIINCKQLNREDIKQKAAQKWSWKRSFDIFSLHYHA